LVGKHLPGGLLIFRQNFIGVKLLANPLNLLEKRHSNWVSKTVDKRGLEEARRQF
jgi:hypothetical protein